MHASTAAPAPIGGFRPDIEGLRAVAILLVVIYHAGVPFVSGGYIGVDVFFVLSGYLITGLLVNELDATGRIDFARFYARRARRLLPAAALVIVVTLLAANLVYSPQGLRAAATAAVTMSVYLSNVWFARDSTDYLADNAAPNVFLHSWSLSVEEQFYLVWPIFMLLAFRWVRGGDSRYRLMLAMAGLALVSFFGCVWLTSVLQPWAFFGSPLRAWEFAIGGMAVLVPAQAICRWRISPVALQISGLLIVLACGLGFDHDTRFPGAIAAVPVLGTAIALLGFTAAPASIGQRLLGSGLMQWIGHRSYSWYLWHWPVLILGRTLIDDPSAVQTLAMVALSLLLADLSLRGFENPIRFNRRLSASSLASIALGLMLSVACAISALGWREYATNLAETPAMAQFLDVREELPRIYDTDCHASFEVTEPVDCTFGMRNASKTVILVGDSHAAQWFPALEAISKRQGWRLMPYTKSACPFAPVPVFSGSLGRIYHECGEWQRKVMARITELRPQLIVIGQSNYVRQGDDASPGKLEPAAWENAQSQLFRALAQAQLSAVVIGLSPRPDFDVPNCLARDERFPTRDIDCSFVRTGQGQATQDLIEEAAEDFRRVKVIDMGPAICPESPCQPISPKTGVVRFRDEDHLSVDYAVELAPVLERAIVPLIR